MLQSLCAVPPSTTSYYKIYTKHFPILFAIQILRKALPSTTLHDKVCTLYLPVLLCTTKLAQIKGPESHTLPPIMSNKCCSGTGREGKTKEVEDREVKKVVCEELCVTHLCV